MTIDDDSMKEQFIAREPKPLLFIDPVNLVLPEEFIMNITITEKNNLRFPQLG
jgi:hypothetical protein